MTVGRPPSVVPPILPPLAEVVTTGMEEGGVPVEVAVEVVLAGALVVETGVELAGAVVPTEVVGVLAAVVEGFAEVVATGGAALVVAAALEQPGTSVKTVNSNANNTELFFITSSYISILNDSIVQLNILAYTWVKRK